MPPNHGSSQQPPPQRPKNPTKPGTVGKRYVLSARAQSMLTWILEDIIEKTLEDARQMAEAAGKHRVELVEVEEALKRLCERYHARWSAESGKSAGSAQPPAKNRKNQPKRF